MTGQPLDLSIIIVSYNTRALTTACLQSIYSGHSQTSFETIIVDNASKDGTVEATKQAFSAAKVIANIQNVGFARANNAGISHARGRYVLLLNSDTVVMQDTIDIMVHFMDSHPDAGAAGCKVVLPSGTLDLACRRGFPTPWNSLSYGLGLAKLFPKSRLFAGYQLTYLDENETSPVDSLVGAFMMVRREALEQVGLLDEAFFFYGEDIDWCYRIKQAGWEIYYHPEAKVIHFKGASTDKRDPRFIWEFYRAMLIFYDKHYKRKYPMLVGLLVRLGVYTQYGLALLKNAMKRR